MTDVRLTATNPEDSSVVPVACNEKGELKLEEPITSPPFDGNLDGDLSVTGSAAFQDDVVIGAESWADDNATGITLRDEGQIACRRVSGSNQGLWTGYAVGESAATSAIYSDGSAQFEQNVNARYVVANEQDPSGTGTGCFQAQLDGTTNARINADGSASFANVVKSGTASFPFAGGQRGVALGYTGQLNIQRADGSSALLIANNTDVNVEIAANGSAEFAGSVTARANGSQGQSAQGLRVKDSQNNVTMFSVNGDGSVRIGGSVDSWNANINLVTDGSVQFAGGKAGITKDGNLYVTTLRGNTVMLNNLVNGLGEWIEYTPPSRKDQIKEKVENWSEKDTKPSPKPTQE